MLVYTIVFSSSIIYILSLSLSHSLTHSLSLSLHTHTHTHCSSPQSKPLSYPSHPPRPRNISWPVNCLVVSVAHPDRPNRNSTVKVPLPPPSLPMLASTQRQQLLLLPLVATSLGHPARSQLPPRRNPRSLRSTCYWIWKGLIFRRRHQR